MYAISRIEAKPGIWCWAVAFRRRGKAYAKAFYDLRRGGSQKALAAAVAWRDQQLERVRTLSKQEFCQIVRSTNRSGVPGVHFLKPKNQARRVWQAKLKIPSGKQITRTFSVRKYGKRGAFDLAVVARSELLAPVEDGPYLANPTAKAFAATRLRATQRAIIIIHIHTSCRRDI